MPGGVRTRWSVIAVEELQVWRWQTGGRCVNQPGSAGGCDDNNKDPAGFKTVKTNNNKQHE